MTTLPGWLILFTLLLVGGLQAVAADRPAIYPFDVRVGGQLAVVTESPDVAIVARVPEPVAADAELEVTGEPGMLIINLFPAAADGEVAPGAQPKIILLPEGTKVSLSHTMDSSTLEPGIWLANVVFQQGTSRVLFEVK